LNLSQLARRLWTASPRDVVRRVGRRLHREYGPDYSLEGIRGTKHVDFNLIIDKWERYWRVLGAQHAASPPGRIAFQDRVVIELGCGPLLGVGPLAHYQGASSFYYSEPAIHRSVVESQEMRESYFRPLFEDFVVNLGKTDEDFDAYYSRMLEKSRPLDAAGDREEFADVVFSNSVLEHISRSDLPDVLSRLRRASTRGADFLHVVDFGPHRGSSTGLGQLETLYQQDWADETGDINHLRLSDIRRALEAADLAPDYVTIYRKDPVDRSRIHESWTRYSDEDLASRVVLFDVRTVGV
jgi:hypothetical protein